MMSDEIDDRNDCDQDDYLIDCVHHVDAVTGCVLESTVSQEQ